MESFNRSKSAAVLQEESKKNNEHLDDVIKERDSLRTAIQILKQDFSTACSAEPVNKAKTVWRKPKKTAKIRQNSTPQPFSTSNSFNQLSDSEGNVVTETYGDKPTFSKRKFPVHNKRSGVNKTSDLHKKAKVAQKEKSNKNDNDQRGDGPSRGTQDTMVLGDSLIKDLMSDLFTSKSAKQKVNVKCFRGAASDDMHHYIIPPLSKSNYSYWNK